MSDERNRVALLPCPFCGKELSISKSGMATHADQSQGDCIIGSMGIPTDHPASVAKWNTRADAALAEIGGVRVKPLVWDEPCAANNHIYMARAPWGTYGIHIDGGRHRAWLEAYEKPYERWLGDDDVGSVYEAQSAAEDDHRDRILAAIDPAPVSVREAARVLLDEWRQGEGPLGELCCYSLDEGGTMQPDIDGQWVEFTKIEAALAAQVEKRK